MMIRFWWKVSAFCRRLVLALLHGREGGVVRNWTPARSKYYERHTLESLGLSGHHFAWSRTIAEAHKQRQVQPKRKSADVLRIAGQR